MLSNAEKITRLRIARSENVGPATFWQLLKMYGTAERALNAMPELAGYGGKKGYKLCSLEKIEEEIYFMKSINGRYAFFEDELYPPLLREIVDAPPVLTFLGDKEKVLSFYEKKMVSIVGARNSSICANKFCENLSLELGSHGVVVVSGMARGIDTSAHTGGLKNGTIAVLAGGGDVIYPPENKKLYNEILQNGGVFAEMPIGTAPQPQLFPRRNRLIAGMSVGTIVIEAAMQSGSLITARMALEYARDVFAVPGSPMDPRSLGCNTLLKEGAILVQTVQDVLDYIVYKQEIAGAELFEERCEFYNNISNCDLENVRKKILTSLSATPITIEELISYTKVSPQEVLIAILELELANKIVRLHGQKVCLALECV